ncbi:MAG TPA: dolichyl-phosphate beta-glucosyltransferase [Vicinamibacterales bacterium]|nr:dolichyl-phosphate beta-glucosyltransferase [Vicinamibacterales bacterium]
MPALSVSIVIPAFNEERRLGATLAEVSAYLRAQPWDWEVRVVDDGSGDGTAVVAEQFAATEPRVIVQREPHRGKGGAVKAGLLAARGSFRFICDADLSMPIQEVVRFLPPQAGAFDVAIGSREGMRARRVGEPLYRHVMGRLFNLGVQWLVLPGIEDSQCGFKMFTADAARSIFPRVTVDGWAFDVEVLAVARARNLRVIEVPIEWHYRAESRLSMLRDGWEMLKELLRIRLRAARGAYRSKTM